MSNPDATGAISHYPTTNLDKDLINHHYQASMHSDPALSGFVPRRPDATLFVGSWVFEPRGLLIGAMSNTHLLEMPSSNNPPARHGLADLRLPVQLRGEIAPPLTTPRTAMATNTSRQSQSQFTQQEIEDLADTASNISPTQPVQSEHGPASSPTNYTSFPDPASAMLDVRLLQPVDAEEEDRPHRSFHRRNALIPAHASSPNYPPTSPLSSNSTPLASIHDDLSDQSSPSPRFPILQNTMRSEDLGSGSMSSSSSSDGDNNNSDNDRVRASDHVSMNALPPPPPPPSPSLSSSFNRDGSPSPQPLPSPLSPWATRGTRTL